MLMERWTAKEDEGFKVVRDRPHTPANQQPYVTPPALARLVRVRAIRGFVGAHGKTIKPGEVGYLRLIDARDMVKIGRCQFVDPEDAA